MLRVLKRGRFQRKGDGECWVPTTSLGRNWEAFERCLTSIPQAKSGCHMWGVVGVMWRVLRDGEGRSKGGFSGSEASSSSLF